MADPIENRSVYCPSIFRRNPLASGMSAPKNPPAMDLFFHKIFLVSRVKSRNVGGKMCVCFRIINIGSGIKFYTEGNGCLKADAEIDIPEIFNLQIGYERRRVMNSGNVHP